MRLPLFPLESVLLPGVRVPLHVFEERYRRLVGDLLELPEGAGRRFGVVAIRRGREVGTEAVPELHRVGCTAQVLSIGPTDNGGFDLVAVGGVRFRLLDVVQAGTPYLLGRVELLSEPVGSGDVAALCIRVADAFHAYVAALSAATGGAVATDRLPNDPVALSYTVAAAALLETTDRQRLLAAPDAVARLRAERSVLARETRLLRRLRAVPASAAMRRPAPTPN